MLLEATHCTSVISVQQVCFETSIYCDLMNEQELDRNEKGFAQFNLSLVVLAYSQTRNLLLI